MTDLTAMPENYENIPHRNRRTAQGGAFHSSAQRHSIMTATYWTAVTQGKWAFVREWLALRLSTSKLHPSPIPRLHAAGRFHCHRR